MLIRLIDANEIIGRVISTVAVLFAAIIIYDVVMRYAFHLPTLGLRRLKATLRLLFHHVGGYALRHKAHVRVIC